MSFDPYVYPGTTLLKNIPGIRDEETLDRFEADRVGQRSLELIENPLSGLFDAAHLQQIHRYLFQDVYEWAGHFRTVDIAKGNSYFAHVPYIRSTLEGLFERLSEEQHLRGVSQEGFTHRAAEILGTLNAVHPFREGNGRTQREFVRELAHKNGYWLDWSIVSREELYKASDVSFMRGENELFEELLKKAIEPVS
ncbi:MAG TPA: Fic family protein [Candidatus Acidoferrales bacterium]|jgi:cell filamentation protein|nr:Fic family protein [Candidatus Acidoferrales bacterium]